MGEPQRTSGRRPREVVVAVLAMALLAVGVYAVVGGGVMTVGAAAQERATVPADPPPLDPPSAAEPSGGEPSSDPADGSVAGTEGLDAELVARFLAARQAAAAEGVELTITSGLRTAAEQQRLFDEAVEFHGTEKIAARWVLPPEESGHVQGTAIDVGPMAGRIWLGEHGEQHGLCQVYENEPWHFEATVDPGQACPAPLTNASAG